MNRYLEDELNDAMNTLEVLINSEHRELFLDVISTYVRNKNINNQQKSLACEAMQAILKA